MKIRTKERCPRCRRPFEETPLGLVCKKCFTTPRRYFVYLSWKGRRIRIYSFKDGQPLSSWELARRAQEIITHEIESGTFDPSKWVRSDLKEYLVSACFRRWFDYCARRLKPGTLKERKRIFQTYVLPVFGAKDVREIRSAHLLDFYQSLRDRGLSAKTIKNILDEFKALFRFAHKMGDVDRVPTFPEVRAVPPPIKWIDEETQLAILSHIPERHKPIFVFLITYGCRPGEARALKWDCVDFRNRVIVIKRTFSRRTVVDLPKENDWKVLPMLPHVEEMLKELARNRRSEFVFSHDRASHYGESRLAQIWREACRKVGVDIPLYAGVRHSFVMQRLEMGFTYAQIGACLGHKVLETTKRYGKLQAQRLAPVFEKVVPFPAGGRHRKSG